MQQRQHPCQILLILALLLAGLPPNGVQGATHRKVSRQSGGLATLIGKGLRLGVPSSWSQVQNSTQVAGIYHTTVAAPACASAPAAPFCAVEGGVWPLVDISAERVVSRATPPGDELAVRLKSAGYPVSRVALDGAAAMRYRETDNGRWGQTVVLESGGVYYHLRFSTGLLALPGGPALMDTILASVVLTPETAPEPFLPAVSAYQVFLPQVIAQNSPARSASALVARLTRAATAAVAPLGGVSKYDAAKAAQYAWDLGGSSTNSDGCYITMDNAGIACNTKPEGVDGAHFIDCALKEGGLPGARCSGLASILNMQGIRTLVLGSGLAKILTNSRDARPGDLMILSSNGNPCWGGVVVSQDGSIAASVRVAAHSDDFNNYDPNAMRCGSGGLSREYIRLDGAAPTVVLKEPEAGTYVPGLRHVVIEGQDDAPAGELVYTLKMRVSGGAEVTLADRTLQTAIDVSLNTPCRALTLSVTAFDVVGNTSDPATRDIKIGLWGDANSDGRVDAADLRLLERAWGASSSDSDFIATLDINTDGRIDAADSMWVRRHQGDRCP